jgi:hypothetical protein
MILCLVGSIAVAIVVVFAIVGGLNLGGSTLSQALSAAVAVIIGYFAGRAIHAKFFAAA